MISTYGQAGPYQEAYEESQSLLNAGQGFPPLMEKKTVIRHDLLFELLGITSVWNFHFQRYYDNIINLFIA